MANPPPPNLSRRRNHCSPKITSPFSTLSTHSDILCPSITALRKLYSITSSAVASTAGGTSMPSARAADWAPYRFAIHSSIVHFLLKLTRRIAIYEPRVQPHLFTWLLSATVMSMIGQGAVLNSMSRHRANISEGLGVLPKATIVEVHFAPSKTVAEISQFLETYKASLVDGPLPGGSYRLRISNRSLLPEQVANIVNRMMQDQTVAFAAGGQ